MTRMPIALAYCMATWPKLPDPPTITTHCPGRTSDTFKPLYTVTPAQQSTAACSLLRPFGTGTAKAPSTIQYSANVPWEVNPVGKLESHYKTCHGLLRDFTPTHPFVFGRNKVSPSLPSSIHIVHMKNEAKGL
jgi:hypothetical protein